MFNILDECNLEKWCQVKVSHTFYTSLQENIWSVMLLKCKPDLLDELFEHIVLK